MKKLNVKKYMFGIFALIACLVFTACFPTSDPNEDDLVGYDISSFQTVYKNDSNEYGYLLEDFVENVWHDFINIYGFNSSITSTYQNPAFHDFSPVTKIDTLSYFDSVRGYAFYDGSVFRYVKNGAWTWNFNGQENPDPCLYNDMFNGFDLNEFDEQSFWDSVYSQYNLRYKGSNTDRSGYEYYFSTTLIPLKIVLYEIVLNKSLSTFNYTLYADIGGLNFRVNGKFVENYLEQLQQEYSTTCGYIGLYKNDITPFINYIIDYVIGENYKNIITTYPNATEIGNGKRYKEVLSYLCEYYYNQDLEPRLNSCIKTGEDANKQSLMMSADDNLINVESHQYQSIIINPSKTGNFYNMIFNAECTSQLNLTVIATYHNLSENLHESTSTEMNLSANTTLSTSMIIFIPTQNYMLSPILSNFDNNVFASQDISNNAQDHNHALSEYYQITENSNNILTTSINTQLLDSSFCETGFLEITFIPDKNINFKFGIFSFLIND